VQHAGWMMCIISARDELGSKIQIVSWGWRIGQLEIDMKKKKTDFRWIVLHWSHSHSGIGVLPLVLVLTLTYTPNSPFFSSNLHFCFASLFLLHLHPQQWLMQPTAPYSPPSSEIQGFEYSFISRVTEQVGTLILLFPHSQSQPYQESALLYILLRRKSQLISEYVCIGRRWRGRRMSNPDQTVLNRRPSRSAATTTFSLEVFDNEVVPSALASISPILRVANEIETERPRVAYLCMHGHIYSHLSLLIN